MRTPITSSDGAERGAWLRGACVCSAVQCGRDDIGGPWSCEACSSEAVTREAMLWWFATTCTHTSHGWVGSQAAGSAGLCRRTAVHRQPVVDPTWLPCRSHLATASIPLGYGRVASPAFARSSSASHLCHAAQYHAAQCHGGIVRRVPGSASPPKVHPSLWSARHRGPCRGAGPRPSPAACGRAWEPARWVA